MQEVTQDARYGKGRRSHLVIAIFKFMKKCMGLNWTNGIEDSNCSIRG